MNKQSIITNDGLPDIQASVDGFHKKHIDKVGVRNIQIPFEISTKDNKIFDTIATVSSYVNLHENLKGINMSRIGRTVFKALGEDVSIVNALDAYLDKMEESHGSENTYVKFAFDYLIKMETPMSGLESYEPAKVVFESKRVNGVTKNMINVTTTQMSLCPCSKEMSLLKNNINEDEKMVMEGLAETCPSLYEKMNEAGFGAHNQKSIISVTVELDDSYPGIVWIEDIVDIVRKNASSPTWSILKRADEKYVTEISYMGKYINDDKEFVEVETNSGAKFVEDESRDISAVLEEMVKCKVLKDFTVVVDNQESIHSGDIVATSVLSLNDLK